MFSFFKKKRDSAIMQQKHGVFIQENRIYISNLQKENDYYRDLMIEHGWKVKTREEFFKEITKKEQDEMNEKMNDKIAEIKAQQKIAEEK